MIPIFGQLLMYLNSPRQLLSKASVMKCLKYLSLLVAVLALRAHAELSDEEEEHTMKNPLGECISETEVDAESTEKLLKANSGTSRRLLDDDDKLKHFVLCMYKKGRTIDAEGLVQKNRLKKDLGKQYMMAGGEAKVNEIVNKCAVQRNSTVETAAELLICLKSFELVVNAASNQQ